MATDETLLKLVGLGIVPYSCRGATQTLEPLDQAAAVIYRDVNGVARVRAGTSFQKYKSTITCTDQRPFSSDAVWPGKAVTVHCIAQLAYLTAGGSPDRPVADGGSETDTDGEFTFYHPKLDMIITAFSIQKDEFGAEVSWTMTLEEV